MADEDEPTPTKGFQSAGEQAAAMRQRSFGILREDGPSGAAALRNRIAHPTTEFAHKQPVAD